MKILAITTVSSLTLFGAVLISAASADTTPSPSSSVPPKPHEVSVDAQVNDESDALGLVGINQDGQNAINDQGSEDSNSDNGDGQSEDSSVQENDSEVDDLNTENQQEEDSFTLDIDHAEQNGNHDDAIELAASAAIVTTVTTPEIQAMSSDNSKSHGIIFGTPTK